MQQQIQQIQQMMNALQTQSSFGLHQKNTEDQTSGIDSPAGMNVGSNTNSLNGCSDLVENLSGAVSGINQKQSNLQDKIAFFNNRKG